MWDVAIVLTSMAAGAALMRWADIRVEDAKEEERRKWRSVRVIHQQYEEDPGEGFAPLPLQINQADHDDLVRNGRIAKKRINRGGRGVS